MIEIESSLAENFSTLAAARCDVCRDVWVLPDMSADR